MIGLPKPTLHREVAVCRRDYDWTVIDGPPHVDTLTRAAAAASDLVLIPVQPSPLDVWATEDVVTLLAECAVVNPDMRTRFVLNRLRVPHHAQSGSDRRPRIPLTARGCVRQRDPEPDRVREGDAARTDRARHPAARGGGGGDPRARAELVQLVQIQEPQHAN